MSSSQDFTNQVDLSSHLDAIPFIPAKSGKGFHVLDVTLVDTKRHDRMGETFLPTYASYRNKEYIEENDHELLEALEKMASQACPMDDFGSVSNRTFKIGAAASAAGEVEIAGSLHRDSEGALLLLDCKRFMCEHRRLIDFLKRNVHNMCQSTYLQGRLYQDPSRPNSRRVLLAVVMESLTGFECTGVVLDSGARGTAKIALPAIPAAGVEASLENQQTQITSQRGVIGIVVAIMKLESSPASQTVRVMPNVDVIQRVDDERFDKALSWQKMPFFLKCFARRRTASHSFVLGQTASRGNSFDSFHTAQELAARNAPGNAIDQEGNGHAILRGEPVPGESARGEPMSLYSPQRVHDQIHFTGSMNFLYEAALSELEEIYGKVRSGASVEVLGYNITSVTPAVPFSDAEFVPIHYTVKGDVDPEEVPGALLRYEGDFKVLVPIDPLGNGSNNKEAITISTNGWEVQESIMYVDGDDLCWKQELESSGYHCLAKSEADAEDVRKLNLDNKEYFVMGRQELVNVSLSDDEGHLSREYPWRASTEKELMKRTTRPTVATYSGDSSSALE